MSQALTSSRLSNSSVNINGATTAIKTNFGLDRIGVTGNSFDISSSSGNVTLGITGTGNVALGNATSGAVSFPGTTTFSNLKSSAAGTNMSIGGNLTTGVLLLGGTGTTRATSLYGTLAVPTIYGPTAGSAMTIGSNITAGSVTIGNAAANNTVTIGNNGAGPTGTVNLGPSSAAVNVGTAQPGIVTVGVTGGTAWISGTVNIGATGGGNVAIGPNAGSITNIGNNNTAATTVNVGNTGTSAFGTVNVGRGATAVFIGDNVASAITLGKTGGSVTLGPPLTLGAAPTVVTGPTGSPPYLGGVITAPFLNPTFTGTNPATAIYGTLTLTPGVYILNASGLIASSAGVFQSFSGILTDGTIVYASNTPFALSSNQGGSGYTWGAHVTAIVAITTTKSINFVINIYLGSGSVNNNGSGFVYNAVRIA
jgi:hypothetical protein